MGALFAIGLAAAIAGGVTGIIGASMQGAHEREQLEEEKRRKQQMLRLEEEQAQEERTSLLTQQAMDESTLMTQAGAMGVEGTFTEAYRGFLLGEYNRAIGGLDRQIQQRRMVYDWEMDDIGTAIQQSKVNQGFSIASSILDIGTNVAGMSLNYKSYKNRIRSME